MYRLLASVLTGLTLSLASGCDNKGVQQEVGALAPETGPESGGHITFKNEFFGLSAQLPKSWNIQDSEAVQQVQKIGNQLIVGDNEALKAALEAGEDQTTILLMATKHPMGAPVDFNANLTCVAESLKHAPGVKTSEDYFFHMKKMLQGSAANLEIGDTIESLELGGQPFSMLRAKIIVGNVTVDQAYYMCITKRYALGFIISFQTDEDKALLDGILDTIAFEKLST